jgi:Resolvase, N terminal domain
MLKAEDCKRIFNEKLSGREGMKRGELNKAIEALGPGDVLVLAEWDRATPSMLDGIKIIEPRGSSGSHLQGARSQVAGSHHADRERHPRLPCPPWLRTSEPAS